MRDPKIILKTYNPHPEDTSSERAFLADFTLALSCACYLLLLGGQGLCICKIKMV